MNFQLDEDTILLRDSVRELGRQNAEAAAAWDVARALPQTWIPQLAEQGLLAMRIPEAEGGAGLSTLSALAVLEELAAFDAATAFTLGVHNVLGLGHAAEVASGLVEAGALVGFAETDGDGDAVVAHSGPDGWTLQGTKSLAFLPTRADAWVVTATVQGATRAFVVRRGPAVTAARARTLGLRAADLGSLSFAGAPAQPLGTEVRPEVYADWLLALGFVVAGVGRSALAEGTRYAQERQQFGRPIAAFQAIQWKLADLATALDAAQLMLGVACGRRDDRTAAAARAACGCIEPVTRGCSEMLQIHGGYGYTHEFAVERAYRDARALAQYAGVPERTKAVAARSVVDRFGRAAG